MLVPEYEVRIESSCEEIRFNHKIEAVSRYGFDLKRENLSLLLYSSSLLFVYESA